MATLAQLQTWLSEAESARDKVATGKGFVSLQKDGRSIRYTAQNIADLNAYIDRLERQIEVATAKAAGRPGRSAISVHFG